MEDNNIKSHSVLLYNTQNIDAQLLKAGFSIRKKEYQRIWKDIQTSKMTHPETHYLIQGVRGAGKTTLLSRLSYEVAEDKKLSEWLIPILLNEEEYGILSLFTFWLRIAEKLAEHDAQLYLDLFQQVLSLGDDAVVAWELIQHYLDENKQKIIVFVDNLGELFKDFDEIEHAQLREVLSLHPHIRLIGGSSQSLEAHFDVSAPFYQFFKLINLKSIDETEMHELLRSLAKQTGEEAVKTIEEIITEYPERIEAVRRLTDGVPRTIVLLFQIIMEGAKESSYAYLEETIDKTTPLYKHRMDDLSRQQKGIVHTIAMNWDAMSTKEIAEQTRLPSKTVSAQLVKLQQQWIVDKIETNTKNHLYIIKERFFNIWYLMRYGSQTDKRRVLWLTRFLESWYDYFELNYNAINIALSLNNKDNIPIDYINAYLSSQKVSNINKSMVFDSVNKKDSRLEKKIIDNYLHTYNNEEFLDEFYKHYDAGETIHYIELLVAQKKSMNLNNITCAASLVKRLGIDGLLYHDLIEHAEKIAENKRELAYLYYNYNLDSEKNKAAEYVKIGKENLNFLDSVVSNIVMLWTESFEDLIVISFDEEVIYWLLDVYFTMLLSKNQFETALNLLNQNNLREELKPFYYATVSLLKDKRRQEYLRMGSELQGTVDEILRKVEEFRIKYA